VAPALRERSVLAKQLRLDVAQLTDVGRKREHNEDNMAYVIPKDPQVMAKKGALFIVADGMGGHAAGEVASEIAVDTVSNVYYQDDSDDVAVSLLHAIRRANAAIHQRAAENMLRSGMGTTCVAAVLRGNMAYIANVGDSRAYLLRGNQVKQISQDHSWVAEQVRAGLLTEDQARTHAQRNVITRCLGTQAEVEIDVFREELSEGDSLVLCTDGLSGLVSDEELYRIVDQYVPQESVYHLVERANENGGPDNITAIVVRVHELGMEPPGVRYPVGVGGREMGEDTAILGMLPGSSPGIVTSNGDGRISSAPLRLSSGPLTSSPNSITAPQPALGQARRSRGRLFYPTLALLILFVLAGVGGAAYFFLRANESQAANQALNAAQQHLNRASGYLAVNNPTLALTELAAAQKNVRDVQKNHQLDSGQQQQLATIQDSLVTQVKNAIVSYDQQAHIFVLPCTNTSSTPINAGTNPQSIVWAQGAKGASILYALGQDSGLYQVNNQNGLLSRIPSNANLHILNISSIGARLFVLVEQLKASVPTGYTLNVYQPDQAGALGNAASSAQIGANFIKDGYAPILTTAWGQNVYVILLSKSNPTNARALSYVVDANGHLGTPKATDFSVSVPIVSVTAFPQQLFLSLSDGEVQSLSLPGGGQPPLAAAVLVQSPIATPLSTSGKAYSATMDVPAVTSSGQKGSTALGVTGASPTNTAMLATGQVNGVPHLYIGDPVNHRVLDLDVAAVAGGPATPAATGTSGSSVTLQLVQQYVSPTSWGVVKSLAVEPKGTQLQLLSQGNSSMMSLVAVTTGQLTGCSG
jgi:serine/threonine protein phosphatase PrpC